MAARVQSSLVLILFLGTGAFRPPITSHSPFPSLLQLFPQIGTKPLSIPFMAPSRIVKAPSRTPSVAMSAGNNPFDQLRNFIYESQERGMRMIGWQGKEVDVPFAISGSRVSNILQNPNWPSAWPYKDSDFRRMDESNDEDFYFYPRFVEHIDGGAIGAIRDFYELQFAKAPQGEFSVLDLCSSWISHYPADLRAKRVAITGMNEQELTANKQATEYIVKDLNTDPSLPFGDNEFDFVTNVVSVDYLSRPREIFTEMHRVLKPGGVAIMSFSNRCFATKAIAMWVANMDDGPGHCQIVGNYFHFNPEGGWRNISSVDISQPFANPMWVVTAVKA